MSDDADTPRTQHPDAEIDLSDEAQDFRFLTLLTKNATSASSAAPASIPKRGEKDFEPDGTDLQSSILSDSRAAMHTALSGVREISSKAVVTGTWRSSVSRTEVASAKGTHFRTIGQADKKGVLWLLPEETMYMVERGNLECWWEEGIPMSVQGVYASCLQAAGGLERFQVYAYLKRAGYILLRAPGFEEDAEEETEEKRKSAIIRGTTDRPGIFASMFKAVFGPPKPGPEGPLAGVTTYRSYKSIYERLDLIPCHHPPHTNAEAPAITSSGTKAPFKIAYHVWKPRPTFKKSAPGEPDFRIAVISARDTAIPTLEEMAALMDSVPVDETMKDKNNMFLKLKDGYRNVILAVNDNGVTSFVKFGDVGFSDHKLYDRPPPVRGGKRGGFGGRGRGGRGGRGGQGGRGRGQ